MLTRLLCVISLLLGVAVASLRPFQFGRSSQYGLVPPPLFDVPSSSSVDEGWYEQKLDHATPTDRRMWQQRFFSNAQYYKRGAPIFLLLGGESPAALSWMTYGSWATLYGRQFNAMLYQLEHRYYGESHPVKNTTLENLQYLSSEQALADAAAFIVNRTAEMGLSEAKWVTFGGSYSGMLSIKTLLRNKYQAWLRNKYPHLVHIAIASSAPVEAQVDFSEAIDNDAYAMRIANQSCASNVAEAFRQIGVQVASSNGRAALSKQFRLCQPMLGSTNEVATFFESIASQLQFIIQYNRVNAGGGPFTWLNIDKACSIMDNNDNNGDVVARYANLSSVLLDALHHPCLSASFAEIVAVLSQTGWNSPGNAGGARQFIYQQCTEFGFWKTTDMNHVYGDHLTLDLFLQLCPLLFDHGLNKSASYSGVAWTNANYGGRQLQGTRTVFVNGLVDPWQRLSIVHSSRPSEMPALVMPDTAHCANMYPPGEHDSRFLAPVRRRIVQYLHRWLQES